ncbi:serine/threonine protein phosphatase [Rhodobacteraceae bacterium 2CG4]|uniref:Serine/threonine protein phosphatase n=1 Tax=Halovulum marinum TaxID=2662447 RepID=A0A6L5YWH8_9RHOB|nr:metallophosphoesterase family protein [Halovulum marinum]MSU88557.1 serine/threonine protein phosphatase [Halovulum marinum]
MPGTDGRRIYAIGDVHGCLEQLDTVLDRIAADLAQRPHDAPLIVFLGDYGDRGPDSRGVIERLVALAAEPLPTLFLLGNHDHMFLEYLREPPVRGSDRLHWLSRALGGSRTLASYGVTANALAPGRAHRAFVRAVPAAHVAFLEGAAFGARIGGYFFAHAGIRPGVPLDRQDLWDLIWIREPFLSDTGAHPAVVVHGHTPTDRVENHGNRIGVDTGAVFGGRLSCIVLEDEDQAELTGAGLASLPLLR